MTVNPFWFGYLMGLITFFVIMVLFGYISRKAIDDDNEEQEQEIFDKLTDMVESGKINNVKIERFTIGDFLEEKDDES